MVIKEEMEISDTFLKLLRLLSTNWSSTEEVLTFTPEKQQEFWLHLHYSKVLILRFRFCSFFSNAELLIWKKFPLANLQRHQIWLSCYCKWLPVTAGKKVIPPRHLMERFEIDRHFEIRQCHWFWILKGRTGDVTIDCSSCFSKCDYSI